MRFYAVALSILATLFLCAGTAAGDKYFHGPMVLAYYKD